MAGGKIRHRGRGPRALAEAVAGITGSVFGRRGFAGGAVLNDWPAIVGPGLAAHTLPERIVRGTGKPAGGVLHLRVDSGALATELQHLEPLLIERVNGYFGYRAVSRLKLLQAPLPKKEPPAPAVTRPLNPDEEQALARSLAGVADGDLRDALEGLGRAVMGRAGSREKS